MFELCADERSGCREIVTCANERSARQVYFVVFSAFAHKFSTEYNEYLKLKNSNEWKPRLSELKK